MHYPIGFLYAFPQTVPQALPQDAGGGMDVLTYMTASALPGALATGTTPIIAARIAFEAACRACALIDQAQRNGGDPIAVLGDPHV